MSSVGETAAARPEGRAAAVRMRGICKSFDGVRVLDDVDFEVLRGEVHALAGGNGAGKSTLMKILQGVYGLDAGEIEIDGRPVRLSSIHDARAAGIGMVFQEFSLVPTLTVAQNIALGVEPLGRGGLIRDREAVRRAREVFAEMEVDVDPRAVVGDLGTAYWQLTEIAKALSQDARVLIMDEPTASLAKHEADVLFELVGRLTERGISVIYISHRMDEVYRIADRITILRDGRRLLTEPLSEFTPEQIVEGIVGKEIEGQLAYRQRSADDGAREPLLELREVTAGPRVRDVTFTVGRGEIVGLAGLMGSGRTELARVLFGIDPVQSGSIVLRGEQLRLAGPTDAIAAGIALIPEDRRAQGLVLEHSVRENLTLPLLDRMRRGPLVDDRKGRSLARGLIERFAVKVADPDRAVRLLSGGNQQKVVIAKWLGTDPAVLVMDEPTAGVDIGTKNEILQTIRDLADEGMAVLVISSEYPELLAVSDRVVVLREGAVHRVLDRADIPDENTLQLAVQGA
ncbi:sugar ABC transporter ATP-binding protein [Geodermatophilus ruber]|uniref:Monosaccharide ABC transporter ATP-binding protein, CUT2 family n=1 Tax=Geodermatophilus ruber TaxID=504800 RepID=A0A1I3Z9P1_9ACTN|nr:sugar ABC transporter ATP-binding protein [Geodermatophilus ruber]SFK40713.1 monosaccharide ABC transporter ATP-binding protein, CUT2 family [Geodermatophilus ruber]